MFTAKLVCDSCGYQSDDFVDGFGDDLYTVICQHTSTHDIRIVEVRYSEIPIESTSDPQIEALVPHSEETVIQTNPGYDERLEAPCPKCGAKTLMKTMTGLV